jgi:hypothetical protein
MGWAAGSSVMDAFTVADSAGRSLKKLASHSKTELN